jgi:hypothetical protein
MGLFLVIYSYIYDQEIFLTPGISPFNARSRKHIRQTPNRLMYARERPQKAQRFL